MFLNEEIEHYKMIQNQNKTKQVMNVPWTMNLVVSFEFEKLAGSPML